MEENSEKIKSAVKPLQPSLRDYIRWRKEFVKYLRARDSTVYVVQYTVKRDESVLANFVSRELGDS